MISNTTKHQQQILRNEYLHEHEELVKEFGINPQPVGAYVLVIPIKAKEETKGSLIYIPTDDGDDEAMSIGLVVAFGPTALVGYELPGDQVTRGPEDYGVEVGDFVEYPRHCGQRCGYLQFSSYRRFPAQSIQAVYKEVS